MDIKKEIEKGLELFTDPMKKHYLGLYYDWCLFNYMSKDDADLIKEEQEKYEELQTFRKYFMRFMLGFTFYNSESKYYKLLDIKDYNKIENEIFEKTENESGIFEKFARRGKFL